MSERFMEPVLKTGDTETYRGFESHSLRQKKPSAFVQSGRFFHVFRNSVSKSIDFSFSDITEILFISKSIPRFFLSL